MDTEQTTRIIGLLRQIMIQNSILSLEKLGTADLSGTNLSFRIEFCDDEPDRQTSDGTIEPYVLDVRVDGAEYLDDKSFALYVTVEVDARYNPEQKGDRIAQLKGKRQRIDVMDQSAESEAIIPLDFLSELCQKLWTMVYPTKQPDYVDPDEIERMLPYEQKVNRYIKEVAQLAEITELIEVEQMENGRLIKSLVPKNELVKTHTARRSGATNMYLSGIPAISIMKITGHKTEKEFMKYIKASDEETALELMNHPYFSGKTNGRQ